MLCVCRILANRQSAVRLKKMRTHYRNELVKRVKRLRTEATNVYANITMLQRETIYLAEKNKETKVHLEALRKAAQFVDDLDKAAKDEVQRLTAETTLLGAILLLIGIPPPSEQPLNGQKGPNFIDFNQQK